MSKQEIKNEIEKNALEGGVSPLRLITAMQGELARVGDEDGLQVLIEIKREYIGL